jgi:hypothetical protein
METNLKYRTSYARGEFTVVDVGTKCCPDCENKGTATTRHGARMLLMATLHNKLWFGISSFRQVSSAGVRVKRGVHLALNDNRLRTTFKYSNYFNTVTPTSPSTGEPYYIQDDSVVKVNIVGGDSIGHCEGEKVI